MKKCPANLTAQTLFAPPETLNHVTKRHWLTTEHHH
jgi:hypothetical protein